MSLEIFAVSTPEVIEVAGGIEVVETVNDSLVHEVAPAGPDMLVETVVVAQVVSLSALSTVVDRWTSASIIESATQGPPGPPGPPGATPVYLARRLTYIGGELTGVVMYHDAAATQVAERRVLTRVGGVVTSIEYFDGADVLLRTRTLTYVGGVLTGMSDL